MIDRKFVLAVVFSAVAVPTVFASSGSTWVGGEVGFETHAMQSTRSRVEVRSEAIAAERDPSTADGGVEVGGELGYVPHQHSVAVQNGRVVHTDKFGSTTPPQTRIMSSAEQRAIDELYLN